MPEYRCRDCFLPDLVCRGCCIRQHRVHCFHSVEVSNTFSHLAFVLSILQRWAGNTFIRTSLKALGLQAQLNYLSMRCSIPVPCMSELRVFHTNEIHDVAIDYCSCERAVPNHIQLLRRGLYPASQVTVKTCVTFRFSTLHSHCLSNGLRRTFVGPCHFQRTQRTVHRKSIGVRWT